MGRKMMDINKELLLLFDDPLFVNVKVPAKPLTSDDRMVEKLLAINAFVSRLCADRFSAFFELFNNILCCCS